MPLYLKDKLVSGTGAPGKSAYQTAVEAGYTGAETAFNEALSDVPGHINNTENPHRVTAAQAGAVASTEKGSASGVATLGADSLLTAAQRPKASGLYRDDGTTTLEKSLIDLNSVLSSRPNPNLLDNWYFRNPINQRQGRIVKPNTTYYSDNTLATSAGTTSAYVTAYRYATGTANGVNYASFKLEDSDTAPTYYAAPENVVRGYAGNGYTIDRYRNTNASNVLLIEDDGIRFIGTGDGGFHIKIEPHMIGIGRTYTLSVLVDEIVGTGYIAQWATPTPVIKVGMNTLTFVAHENTWQGTSVVHLLNGEVKVRAAKLELGSQQTLAHQENGVWVLNEIPDYGEQLRRCQRYYYRPEHVVLIRTPDTNSLTMDSQFKTVMRTNPSAIYSNPLTVLVPGKTASGSISLTGVYVSIVGVGNCNLTSATPSDATIFQVENAQMAFTADL